jgi:ankyrin repeat protein
VEVILEHRINLINETNNWGATALHRAAGNGRLSVTKLLLMKGASVNSTDHQGQTALQLATEEGETVIMRLLEESGANTAISQLQKASTDDAANTLVKLSNGSVDALNERMRLHLASKKGDLRAVR